jgi:hypothetical protein
MTISKQLNGSSYLLTNQIDRLKIVLKDTPITAFVESSGIMNQTLIFESKEDLSTEDILTLGIIVGQLYH